MDASIITSARLRDQVERARVRRLTRVLQEELHATATASCSKRPGIGPKGRPVLCTLEADHAGPCSHGLC